MLHWKSYLKKLLLQFQIFRISEKYYETVIQPQTKVIVKQNTEPCLGFALLKSADD